QDTAADDQHHRGGDLGDLHVEDDGFTVRAAVLGEELRDDRGPAVGVGGGGELHRLAVAAGDRHWLLRVGGSADLQTGRIGRAEAQHQVLDALHQVVLDRHGNGRAAAGELRLRLVDQLDLVDQDVQVRFDAAPVGRGL